MNFRKETSNIVSHGKSEQGWGDNVTIYFDDGTSVEVIMNDTMFNRIKEELKQKEVRTTLNEIGELNKSMKRLKDTQEEFEKYIKRIRNSDDYVKSIPSPLVDKDKKIESKKEEDDPQTIYIEDMSDEMWNEATK